MMRLAGRTSRRAGRSRDASHRIDVAVTFEEFLAGAYTTARTAMGATRIFDLNAHVARLAESARLMQDSDGVDEAARCRAAGEDGWMRSALMQSLTPAIGAWSDAHTSEDGAVPEAKVTVLVAWGDAEAAEAEAESVPPVAVAAPEGRQADGVGVYVHLQRLLRPHEPPIRVLVRAGPRSNAAAKDTRWVAERSGLEALMGPGSGVEEVLMAAAGESGAPVMEGTQTNVAAVCGGALLTAREGVLLGTVRRLLVDVAPGTGLRVEERAPTLASLGSWDGALLSSTSRLAMPIDEIRVPRSLMAAACGLDDAASAEAIAEASGTALLEEEDGGETLVKRWNETPEPVARLRDAVADAFAARCEPLDA